MKNIQIYTDGGVRNNGKPDCYGASSYIILLDKRYLSEHSEAVYNTTSNRTELTAIKNALIFIIDNNLYNENVRLISDSQYCVKGCTTWVQSWKTAKFKRDGEDIPNADLWKDLYDIMGTFKHLSFQWVKGHNGNEYNEYVDQLCTDKIEEIESYQEV